MAISASLSLPSIIPTTKAFSFASSNSSFFTNNTTSLKPLTIKKSNKKNKGGFSCNCLFGLGVPELVVIAGVVALVFGPKKLPEVGRSIGKTVKSFQQTEWSCFFKCESKIMTLSYRNKASKKKIPLLTLNYAQELNSVFLFVYSGSVVKSVLGTP
ncbi:sec-independent protein translocase protein TATA, chloroplastic-like protein [Tanacetum coccineum]